MRWWRLIIEAGLNKRWSDETRGSHLSQSDLAEIVDFYLSDFQVDKLQANVSSAALRQSVTDELFLVFSTELGSNAEDLLTKLNSKANQYLRVNTNILTRAELQTRLSIEGIDTDLVPNVDSALKLRERKNVFTTKAYQDGCFEMQDAGSQMIAPFLEPQFKDRVVDACAGAGGKTLHLADLMKNQGRILALDIHEKKLDELKKRARRSKTSSIETRPIVSSKVIKRLEDSADRLLLDVPCTGLGVLRRHPDTKWKFRAKDLANIYLSQSEILESYTKMLHKGGVGVYATCSVLPSENESQVHDFIERSQGRFELEKELNVSPLTSDFDGFFAARFRRIR